VTHRIVEIGLRRGARLLLVGLILAALACGLLAAGTLPVAAARDDAGAGIWVLTAAGDGPAPTGLPSRRTGAGNAAPCGVIEPPRIAAPAPAHTDSPDRAARLAFPSAIRFLPREQIP
jgi:hypothetical protein